MAVTLGIRREDKNEWERRVPLVPTDLAALQAAHDLEFVVQTSPIRVFTDDDYRAAGVRVVDQLDDARIVLAVKEIPSELLAEERTYVYFSHTVKGQPNNMPMLQRLLDLRATLIDYEKIVDNRGRRMIFFSLHAGYAGMIESLVAIGERLAAQGCETALAGLKHAYEYASLDEAAEHLREIGAKLSGDGLGDRRRPLVIGVAGYGNVAQGCQAILDCLPVRKLEVADLERAAAGDIAEYGPLVSVTFREADMVEPLEAGAGFDLQDYYEHPENYRGVFERYLPDLDMLINATYWEERYPRLVTRDWARAHYGRGKTPRLQVIGDISCDIEGGIELTVKAPQPDAPCFVYDPATGEVEDGVDGDGPAIMAVDNLPCELPRESSEHFSSILRDMVAPLAAADYSVDFAELDLPPHLKNAVIAHRGQLAPNYTYLEDAVKKVGR